MKSATGLGGVLALPVRTDTDGQVKAPAPKRTPRYRTVRPEVEEVVIQGFAEGQNSTEVAHRVSSEAGISISPSALRSFKQANTGRIMTARRQLGFKIRDVVHPPSLVLDLVAKLHHLSAESDRLFEQRSNRRSWASVFDRYLKTLTTLLDAVDRLGAEREAAGPAQGFDDDYIDAEYTPELWEMWKHVGRLMSEIEVMERGEAGPPRPREKVPVDHNSRWSPAD